MPHSGAEGLARQLKGFQPIAPEDAKFWLDQIAARGFHDELGRYLARATGQSKGVSLTLYQRRHRYVKIVAQIADDQALAIADFDIGSGTRGAGVGE